MKLLYRDAELHVDRSDSTAEAQFAAYDLVLTSAKGRIVELRNKIGH